MCRFRLGELFQGRNYGIDLLLRRVRHEAREWRVCWPFLEPRVVLLPDAGKLKVLARGAVQTADFVPGFRAEEEAEEEEEEEASGAAVAPGVAAAAEAVLSQKSGGCACTACSVCAADDGADHGGGGEMKPAAAAAAVAVVVPCVAQAGGCRGGGVSMGKPRERRTRVFRGRTKKLSQDREL